jgi:hypothetical protein
MTPFQGVDIAGFTPEPVHGTVHVHSLQASLTRRFSKGMQFLLYTLASPSTTARRRRRGHQRVVNPRPTDTGAILGNQLDNRANRGISDFDDAPPGLQLSRPSRPALATRPAPAACSSPADLGNPHGHVGATDRRIDQLAGSFYGLNNGFARLISHPSPITLQPPAMSRTDSSSTLRLRPAGCHAGQPIPSSGGAGSARARTDIGFVGRNIPRGPRQVNVDFGLARRFRMTESKGIEFAPSSSICSTT